MPTTKEPTNESTDANPPHYATIYFFPREEEKRKGTNGGHEWSADKKTNACGTFLRPRLLLLLFPQSKEGDARDFDDLETHTGLITGSATLTTETSDENFVVLVNKV